MGVVRSCSDLSKSPYVAFYPDMQSPHSCRFALARTKQTARDITAQPKDLAKRASQGANPEEMDMDTSPAQQEVREQQPPSTPNSPDHEDEDRRSATGSSDRNKRASSNQNSHREDSGSSSESSRSSSSEESGSDSGSSSESGEELESVPRTDVAAESEGNSNAPDRQADGPSNPRREEDMESFTGGYSFSGTGDYEWEVHQAISVPRVYSRFTSEVTALRSIFRTTHDLSAITTMLIGKSSRRGLWEVEGMSRSEHAAI